jgi:hypothetical protein
VTFCLLGKSGSLAGSGYWQGKFDVWSQEFFNGLLSFVLSWTLSFALVHGMDLMSLANGSL